MLQSKEDVLNALSGGPIIKDNSGSVLQVDIGKPPILLTCVAGDRARKRISVRCNIGDTLVSSSFASADQFWELTHPTVFGTASLHIGCKESGGYLKASMASTSLDASLSKSRQGSSLFLCLKDRHPYFRALALQTMPLFLGISVTPTPLPLPCPRLQVNAVAGAEWPPQVESSWFFEWPSASLRFVMRRNCCYHFGGSYSFGAWHVDAATLNNRKTAAISYAFSEKSVGLSVSHIGHRASFGAQVVL
ncbi:Hypothetical protein, putative [Bodo saltans]|uniref:Uncharacterized protein n=1 Tax=Bodo saltans TaxID=75058 RepID=A0A0S4IRA1_BODSA|nr:Hypothetical protein, putative [Bodo saltans]|eukprot:CUG01299.1 Hypothetical protein, putative [Bodo saltans]